MSAFGPRTTAEEVIDAFSSQIKGRIFLITGTSVGGLGAYTAINLARRSPAQLILVGRTKAKVDPLISEISAMNTEVRTTFVECELTDQSSIRQAAESINSDASIPHIDVMINNAGVMALPDFHVDKAGYEMQLSANHIGHFLLTNLLLPKVKAAGPGARVLSVSSSGHRISPFRFDDWNFSGGKTYEGWTAYGQSKTANILFTVELAQRGVASLAPHPGTLLETNLGRYISLPDLEEHFKWLSKLAEKNTGRSFLGSETKTLSQGAATVLRAALDPSLVEKSGSYLEDCQVNEPYEYASDKQNARKLWALSEELVGQEFKE